MNHQRFKVSVAVLLLTVMLVAFTGCFQSAEYNQYDQFAKFVQKGKEYTKQDVYERLGIPDGYHGEEGEAFMNDDILWWTYGTYHNSGYPYRLEIEFNSEGDVMSAEFYAPPGG